MFRLSNLITALFGVVAAFAGILGIRGIANTALQRDQQPPNAQESVSRGPNTTGLDTAAPRQVGQNAAALNASSGDPSTAAPAAETATPGAAPEVAAQTAPPAGETATSPSAAFTAQPASGGVEISSPPTLATPSTDAASQLDPTPAPAPPTASPVASPAPAPATPVRAMW